jgi:hypothetical protein
MCRCCSVRSGTLPIEEARTRMLRIGANASDRSFVGCQKSSATRLMHPEWQLTKNPCPGVKRQIACRNDLQHPSVSGASVSSRSARRH